MDVIGNSGMREISFLNSTDNEGDHSIPLIVFISAHDYFSFWRALEIESDDAMSPLRVIETLTTQTFSPPLFAALCSPNLIRGILAAQRLATYKKLVCPMELILDVGRGRFDGISSLADASARGSAVTTNRGNRPFLWF